MSILNILNKKSSHLDAINQTVIIDAPLEVVGAQMTKWFEQTWRPAGLLHILQLIDAESLQAGAQFRAEFKYLLKAQWEFKVARFEPNHLLQSKLSGFFNGEEIIKIEQRDNGIKLDYQMNYELKNPFFQILWSLLMEEKFVRSMDGILNAFKAHCQKLK